MKPRRCASVALMALLATVVACDPAPTRLGATADPVTIRAIYGAAAGGVGSDVLDALVSLTSDQPVRVRRPVAGSGRPQEESDALDALASGKADLTVVRAGALAVRGADSIAVLQTPLLVTSPEHAAKVAADPVAVELMSDLADVGLTGLALVPGGVRHPFGYGRALHGAADYRGLLVNSGPANGVDPMIEALGATPDHSVGHERSTRVSAGAVGAIEASLIQPGAVDRPAVLISNVSLYTRFDVVVIRREAWDGLSKRQQQALRAAAERAGHDAVAARDTEAAALDDWCATPGAASILASAADVASIQDALAPATLTSDATSRAIADRVAALGAGSEPPAGKVCGAVDMRTTNEDFLVKRTGDQSVFDGVWRIDARYQNFVDAGVSAAEAGANAGVWTLRIKDHVATVDQPHGADCAWDFYVHGNRVSLDALYGGNDACYGLALGTWRRDGDVVHFQWDRERYYDVAIDNAMFAGGMHRIG
jgi:TRAP-type C4-dicarboxylate transport system substrate-binding protein